MNSERYSRDCFANVVRLGQGLEEVAADLIKRVKLAFVGGVNHLNSIHPRPRRHVESPQLRERRCAFGVHRDSAGKLSRDRADFRASLNAGVSAYRHQSALVAADKASRQSQIDDRAYGG